MENNKPSVCFGTKKHFKKQFTVMKDDHEQWYRVFRKKRNKGMTISGRKDSINGNFVFRYDPDTRILHYKSMKGKVIEIPDVWFPYGQFLLEQYITKQKKDRYAAIAWRIEKWGGSFIIKCMLTLPKADINYHYGDGCIGMDVNVDHLALSETNEEGNLIHHKILPFDLKGSTSEQAEHILSNILEKVFIYCFETKKPLVIEDLKDVATTSVYGSKALNRVLSSFAHAKIKNLVFSKSWKYQTDVKAVNPAYTSQIGKIKYMRRYGLSIHEAASLAIARRGMGFKEYLPSIYKDQIPKDRILKHHWSHWAYMHKNIFKEIQPSDCYKKNMKITTTA